MLKSVVNYANNSAGEMSVVTDDGRSIDLQSGSVRPLRLASGPQVERRASRKRERDGRAGNGNDV